jgi:4-hydroxy-3-methylbut-2-enyl diphosphate reductase
MTVLLAPMRAEARALRRGIAARPGAPAAGTGMAGGAVPVLHGGVGPVRAARAADRLAGHGVVVAGVGGGLVASLHAGDVVLADEVRGPDGDPVRLDGTAELAALLRAAGHTVHIGPIASRRRIVSGAERDRLAGDEHGRLAGGGALVADTESYWLLSGPARPVGCLRVVADCVPGPVFGPATLWHLRTALRRLRALADVLAGWAATAGPAVRNQSHQPLKEVR